MVKFPLVNGTKVVEKTGAFITSWFVVFSFAFSVLLRLFSVIVLLVAWFASCFKLIRLNESVKLLAWPLFKLKVSVFTFVLSSSSAHKVELSSKFLVKIGSN